MITYGIVSNSGGRWGAQIRHAVVPGSTRKRRTFGTEALSECGLVVTPMEGSARGYDPHTPGSCKRCARSV